MLVYAVETYLGRNKEKLKDNIAGNIARCGCPLKLTSSHSKFGIKIKQKEILRSFIFPAILLDLWMVCCWQLIASNIPAVNTPVKMERIASNIAGNIATCGCPLTLL